MRRLIENWRDGAIKLAMTATLLNFRREHEALFRDGRYEPVLAKGPRRSGSALSCGGTKATPYLRPSRPFPDSRDCGGAIRF